MSTPEKKTMRRLVHDSSQLPVQPTAFGQAVSDLQAAHELPVESVDQSDDVLNELVFGAVLRLPDGSRWFDLSVVCQPGPRAAAYLWGLLTAHGTMSHPDNCEEVRVLLDVDRLDVRRGWCSECHDWIDLEADAWRCDARLGRYPGYEQVLPFSAHERAELEAELTTLRRTR